MRKILTLLAAFVFCPVLFCQQKAPLVSGKIKISIKEGTFDCDVTMSDIPPTQDYFIRLNSGMNPLHFKSLKPNDFLVNYDISFHDTLSTGETKAYYFSDNTGKAKFLPQALNVRYVGKFPVVKDTLADVFAADWKGNIAFNGYSVRTDSFQSCWLPMLYDVASDKRIEAMRYDLEIICEDCSTLYLNGSKPLKASRHRFTSDTPYELSLFCGDYAFSDIGETVILNPDLNQDQVKEFSALINSYRSYYSEKLKVKPGQPVVFVNTTPVSAKNAWLYVVSPTIYNVGWGKFGLVSLFDPKLQNWFKPFIAHEIGHTFFGSGYRTFNSELGNMLSEGLAEYSAMKLTAALVDKKTFEEKLAEKKKNLLEDFDGLPFAKVRSKKDYGNYYLYVYDYSTVIFLAIEKEIGEKLMWKWLNAMLCTNSEFTNYGFITSTLKQALKNEKQFELVKARYFESDKALQNALERIGKG